MSAEKKGQKDKAGPNNISNPSNPVSIIMKWSVLCNKYMTTSCTACTEVGNNYFGPKQQIKTFMKR